MPSSLPSTAPSAAPRHWYEVAHAPKAGTVLGRRDALEDGSATILHWQVPASEDGAGNTETTVFRYLLLRSGAEVKAYVNRCAHFGMPLATRQDLLKFQPHERITCNVHYAHYRWSDGLCIAGDCQGESLLAIPVVVDEDGTIRVAP
nr:Rieske 2Fe-2S domain-containing protein [uncultured Rhodoferax sp.]